MMYAVAAIALLVIWAAAAVLALLVTGKRPRRVGVAAGHGVAAGVLIAAFFIQKVVDLASGGSGLRFAAALWTNANSGVPQWVVVQLVLVSMLAGLTVIVGAALTREAHPVPRIDGGLGRWGAIAGALGLAIAFYAWWSLPTPQAGQPVQAVPSARDFSDALAWLPLAMGAFLVRLVTGDAPESPAPLDVEGMAASSSATRPVEEPWRAAGLIGQSPILALAGRSAAPDASANTRTWIAAGGTGPAPDALNTIAHSMPATDGGVWILEDLPQPTETQVLVSAVLIALRQGRRVIVVTQGAVATRGASGEAINANTTFAGALRSALDPIYGSWRTGRIAVGQEELTQCMTDRVIPAVAVVSVQELSEGLIPHVWQARPNARMEYLFGPDVGLVIVSGIDSGLPVEATHRTLTLKRLFAALDARAARAPALVTATCGKWAPTVARHATNERREIRLPFGPRAQGPVTVWALNPGATRNAVQRWPRTAMGALAHTGAASFVSDPGGSFDSLDIGGDRPDIVLTRDIRFEGDASVVALEEADVAAAWRQLHNRTATDRDHHHSLWQWEDTVLTRAYRSPAALERLHNAGLLPHPRPAIGWDNAHLVRAHVSRMLQEGEPDEAMLRHTFPSEYGNGALAESARSHTNGPRRYAMRRDPEDRRYVRVPLVPRVDGAPQPIRGTVTERTWRVVDVGGGTTELLRVDIANAMTRFYPLRVFSHGEHKYKVKEEPYKQERQEIRVDRLPPGHDGLTEPILRVHAQPHGVTPSFPTIDQVIPGLQIRVATVATLVRESVTGFITRDMHGRRITEYPQPFSSEQYPTRARAILFVPRPGTPPAQMSAYYTLAELVDRILVSYIRAKEEDIHVEPIPAGFFAGEPGGVLIIDRHPGGLGIATAIDDEMCKDVVRWAHHILTHCPDACVTGCPRCTPDRLFDRSARWAPDKVHARMLLGR